MGKYAGEYKRRSQNIRVPCRDALKYHIHSQSEIKFTEDLMIFFSFLDLRGVEWVHDLFLFPLVLGKMKLSHAKLGLFCVVR